MQKIDSAMLRANRVNATPLPVGILNPRRASPIDYYIRPKGSPIALWGSLEEGPIQDLLNGLSDDFEIDFSGECMEPNVYGPPDDRTNDQIIKHEVQRRFAAEHDLGPPETWDETSQTLFRLTYPEAQ